MNYTRRYISFPADALVAPGPAELARITRRPITINGPYYEITLTPSDNPRQFYNTFLHPHLNDNTDWDEINLIFDSYIPVNLTTDIDGDLESALRKTPPHDFTESALSNLGK